MRHYSKFLTSFKAPVMPMVSSLFKRFILTKRVGRGLGIFKTPPAFAGLLLITTASFADEQHPVNHSLKQPGVLQVCSYSGLEPVSFGDGQGFEADVLRAIAALWQVDIVFYPEKNPLVMWALPGKEYTLCDVAIGGFSKTREREADGAIFSEPLANFKQSLLVRQADLKQQRIQDYASFYQAQLKIGVLAHSTSEAIVKQKASAAGLDVATVIVTYPTQVELLHALKKHEVDGIVSSSIENNFHLLRHSEYAVLDEYDYNESFHVATNSLLLPYLNPAIAEVTNNGVLSINEWLTDDAVFIARVMPHTEVAKMAENSAARIG